MKETTTPKKEAPSEELMLLLEDQAATLLDWSWEGTMHFEEQLEKVGESYGYKDTLAVVNSQSAVVQVSNQQVIAKCGIPDVPPLFKVPKLKKWYHNVIQGKFNPEQARKELNSIKEAPDLYSGILRLLGVVLLAVAFSFDVVGTWEGIYVAAITGIPAGICLLATGWIKGFNKIAGLTATFIVGVMVMIAYKFGWVTAAPGLLLIAATFVFIPGDSISTQALEMAAGRWGPGVDRLFYSVMVLALQVIGVILAIIVTQSATSEVFPAAATSDFAWWVIYPVSLIFLLGNMLAFQIRLKDYIPALIILLLTRVAAQLGTMAYGEFVGTVAGMLVATVAAIWYDKQSVDHSPAYVFIITPIFALSPGSHGLRSLECWVTGNEITGVNNLATLGSVLLAIAIGILLGSMLMHGMSGLRQTRVKS